MFVLEDSGDKRDHKEALDLGASLALIKPVNFEELEFLIKYLLGFSFGEDMKSLWEDAAIY